MTLFKELAASFHHKGLQRFTSNSHFFVNFRSQTAFQVQLKLKWNKCVLLLHWPFLALPYWCSVHMVVTVLSILQEFNCIPGSPSADCWLRIETSSQPLCHQHVVDHDLLPLTASPAVQRWLLMRHLTDMFSVPSQMNTTWFYSVNNWSLQEAKCNFGSSVLTCVQPGRLLIRSVSPSLQVCYWINCSIRRQSTIASQVGRHSPGKLLVTGSL